MGVALSSDLILCHRLLLLLRLILCHIFLRTLLQDLFSTSAGLFSRPCRGTFLRPPAGHTSLGLGVSAEDSERLHGEEIRMGESERVSSEDKEEEAAYVLSEVATIGVFPA